MLWATVAQSSLSILKVVCHLCFAFPNHAYYSHGSSASTITSSKIAKVWELLVFRTSQDTNTFHPQQGSLDVCELYSWSLEFWPIEARRQSSNGAISWDIRFATSNLVGVSSNESSFHNSNAQPEVELEVLQQRGNPNWSDKIERRNPKLSATRFN